MKVIGLTGKTGSGKSTVSQELEKNGFFVIDCDIIAREIVKKGMPALQKLVSFFGRDILNEDEALNRKALAKLAFSSKENTEKLNEITHPFITETVKEKIDFAKEKYDYCILDGAALIESECRNLCDFLAVVTANESIRKSRIMTRDNIDEKTALLRMNAQKEDEYYLKNADIILENNTENDLKDCYKKLIEFAKIH